jgi:hypothetical protein
MFVAAVAHDANGLTWAPFVATYRSIRAPCAPALTPAWAVSIAKAFVSNSRRSVNCPLPTGRSRDRQLEQENSIHDS